MNRALKIFYKFLVVFLSLIVILWVLVNTTPFQNWIVRRVTVKLSEDLHAKVSIKHVEFGLFNKMLLEGTLVLDKKNDTLLYAKTAKVNLTDWFFFKDDITLKYIGLDDAIINLNRKDSIWNYQFLVDYFSSPNKKTDTSKNVIKLDLKTVELNRVKIWQKDEWRGHNMLLSFDKLNFTPDVFDTRKKIIRINEINLEHPLYAEYSYQGLRPPIIKTSVTAPLQSKGLQWNEEDWLISVNNIKIKDGGFAIERDNGKGSNANRFDDAHIIASSLNGTLKNFLFEKDTITANVNISVKDRSGFEIKKLAAAYKFTPHEMEFKDLDLITNRSHIKNYYAMRYNDFNKDFANFEQAVTLEANFTGSDIHSDDVAYFSPSLQSWHRNFFINGNVSGTIDNLSGRRMVIRSNNSYFNGEVTIRGLPYETYLNLRSNELRTSYGELAAIIPSLRKVTNPNLRALGNIHFAGTFTGFFKDFVTYGTLRTDLGTLVTDLHMQFPDNSASAYSGKIATNNFQLGRFIGAKNLGSISFNGNVNGRGFTENNVDIIFDGNIRQVEFNNYNYQNITAKGNFKNKIFNGIASINDPNVKVQGLSGTIDFSNKEPRFNFDADIVNLDLKNIKLTNDSLSLAGKFNLNFSGNNIDNFLGSAKIYNATLTARDQKLSFDTLDLRSYIIAGKKYLSVKSNELDANVAGNFKIMELPDAFQLLLNRYYPAYINKPTRTIHAQDFTFDIKTKIINDYIGLLSKKIKGFNNTDINGDLDLSTNTLNIKANVPSFSYTNIDFTNVNFTGAGTFDTLKLIGNIGDVIINDSLHLPDTKLLVTAHNDLSEIKIKTSASKTLNEADLSLSLQTLPDGFKLNFNPSSFVINDRKWVLEKGGQLVLSNKLLSATEVKFVQGDQQVIISTAPSSIIGSGNDVLIELRKLNIGDIVPFFIRTPKFAGLMTGQLKVNDPFGDMTVGFVTQVDQFRFENDSIGVLRTSGSYSAATGDIIANANSNNAEYSFIADLTYKIKDSTNNQLNGSLNLDKSNIHFLQKYLNTIFTGIQGNATGQLNITGRGRDPKITGSVTLNDASLIVNYTRCKYFITNNSVLKFNKDEIDFGGLKIRDTLNSTATITGKMYHTFFDNFYFNDLKFKTDRRNGVLGKFLLINTTAKDNKEFYGHVIGDAEMHLDGPISDMRMTIAGLPTDSSHIYLPTGDVAETGKINYIDFIKFGREMRGGPSLREETNIKVNMDLTATPFVQIDVILDETTGDIIKARGNGRLNINVGTKEPLTIRGRYVVEEGQYTFNFQTFFKTPFTLQSGFIEWQGDPYLANLNIDAIYKARNVDLRSIPTITGRTPDKSDVDVIFKLRGTLENPRPDFEFQFPFGNPLRSDPIASEYLRNKYQADKNEMNKQVTSLLLFNTFTEQQDISSSSSSQGSLLNSNNVGNFVFRSVGQILSSTLSSSLNNWFQKLLKTDQVNLYTNFNTPDFNFKDGITQTEIQNLGNFGFKTAFLKNRLLINFGGNIDYKLVGASSNSNTTFLFTPDVSFEYLITPGGSLRVVGFNRSDADLGDIAGVTRRNRTGILLSYRKDFNSFYELFGIDRTK